MKTENTTLKITIEDNGIGISKSVKSKGLGLVGIQERVNILKGDFKINNNEPTGTKIIITIPLVMN